MSYWKSKLAIFVTCLVISTPPLFAVEYEWTDAAGSVKSLSDYKGKPVVLHFWASWCPPCRSEMPTMESWSKTNSDVEMVIVSLDRDIADATAFLESKGIGFPALQGDMIKAQRLGVRGLPTTLVIGADSTIIKTRIGALHWDEEADSNSILQALKSDI